MHILDLTPYHTPVLDHGFVRLVDCLPRVLPDGRDMDYAIAEMARLSYRQSNKSVEEDQTLIRYLMRHAHTSPSEGLVFKFHVKMPIFVARQWIRHRTAAVNEISARYTELPSEFYIPELEDIQRQSTTNKQGREEPIPEGTARNIQDQLKSHSLASFSQYQALLQTGVARELARACLPVNIYTEMFWQINLHNLLHFCALRADSHAQKEIRVYADAIIAMLKQLIPTTMQAWETYHPKRGAVLLTALEVAALRTMLQELPENPDLGEHMTNPREIAEWRAKYRYLRGGDPDS